MSPTETITTTTTTKTDRHRFRRTLALVVALAALAAALAMALAAGDAQAKKGKPPASAPAGPMIAFTSNRDGNQEIYTMNAADGSGQENLTNNPARDFAPAYSPAATNANGTATIAFETNRTGNTEIFFMDNHGNNPYQLTNNPTGDFGVTYAPDPIDHWNRAFTRVVPTQDGSFNYEIYEMSYLGVTQTNLTNSPATETDPSYSPDGTKIAFTTDRSGNEEIYSMNRDGSSPTNLTNNAAGDEDPDWGVAPAR